MLTSTSIIQNLQSTGSSKIAIKSLHSNFTGTTFTRQTPQISSRTANGVFFCPLTLSYSCPLYHASWLGYISSSRSSSPLPNYRCALHFSPRKSSVNPNYTPHRTQAGHRTVVEVGCGTLPHAAIACAHHSSPSQLICIPRRWQRHLPTLGAKSQPRFTYTRVRLFLARRQACPGASQPSLFSH